MSLNWPTTEFRTVTQVGEKHISIESIHVSIPASPNFLGPPYLRPNGLTRIQEIRYSDTRGRVKTCDVGGKHRWKHNFLGGAMTRTHGLHCVDVHVTWALRQPPLLLLMVVVWTSRDDVTLGRVIAYLFIGSNIMLNALMRTSLVLRTWNC